MNEPPGSRFRVGHSALTMAEYFRDDARQDVLLLIDNIFRFIQAGSEVSGLMGELGYQPTLGTELADLEERICNTAAYWRDNFGPGGVRAGRRLFRSFRGPYVQPSLVLHRALAETRQRGAVSGYRPWPRSGSKRRSTVVGERHYRIAQEIARPWQATRS